jgi:hypothetical protein
MRDGYRNECRDCFRALSRDRYARNRDRYIAGVRRWQRENPERLSAYRRQRNARPDVKRRARDAYYARTYGVSADEVDEMLDAQNGRCAICGTKPDRLASMHVDHDHELGHLRGLLCVSCNQGLGQFRDDPAILLRAIVYLRQRAPMSTAEPTH